MAVGLAANAVRTEIGALAHEGEGSIDRETIGNADLFDQPSANAKAGMTSGAENEAIVNQSRPARKNPIGDDAELLETPTES
jgi:hypothetical protein